MDFNDYNEIMEFILGFTLEYGPIPIAFLIGYLAYKWIKDGFDEYIQSILEEDKTTNLRYMEHENQEEIDKILN